MSAMRSNFERGERAVLLGGDRDVLDLVAAVVGRDQRLRAGLGPLDRVAQLRRDHEDEDLLGGDLQLAAEAAADVGGDHPQLVLGQPERRRQHRAQDVRDLRGRPHGELLAGRVDDHRARLHERRDQPLLAEPRAGRRPSRGRSRRRRWPRRRCRRVPAAPESNTHVRILLVPRSAWTSVAPSASAASMSSTGSSGVVVDLDELGGVLGLGRAAGDDDGDDLAGEVDLVDGDRDVRCGAFMSGVDRPGAGEAALLGVEVGAGVDGDDAGQLRGRVGVDRR